MSAGKFSYILMELKRLHTNSTIDTLIQKRAVGVYNFDWKTPDNFFRNRSNLRLISSAKIFINDDLNVGEIRHDED